MTSNEPEMLDILIRHAYVITMDDAETIIEDGAVAISRGRIVDVGQDVDLAARYTAERVIDADGAPCHPGLIESHAHTSYQTIRGAMADHVHEDDVFDLFDAPFYNQLVDEDEYFSVVHTALEMVRNGTTCFMEAGTVLEPTMLASAAELVGIRAVIGDSFIWDEPDGFAMGEAERAPDARPRLLRTPKNLEEALQRLGGQLGRNADPDALVRGHIALLGLGTASEELMLEAKSRADAAGTVLNIHQSYSPADTAADRRRFGADPLVHLADIGFLDRNVTLAHANHLTDAECEAILHTGATLVWAPAASMMWGHGGTFRGRHAELWRRGANIALGSDSPNWSNDFDLFRQASLAILTAREAHGQRDYLVAEDGFFMATRGGARATGLEEQIGSLEIGKRADIVVHTLDRPELMPTTNMMRNLLYSSRSKSVDTVIIDGKVVLDQGEFLHLDERELLRELNSRSQQLLSRMGVVAEPNRVDRAGRREAWARR